MKHATLKCNADKSSEYKKLNVNQMILEFLSVDRMAPV